MTPTTRDRLRVDLRNLFATLRDLESGKTALAPHELKQLFQGIEKRIAAITSTLESDTANNAL